MKRNPITRLSTAASLLLLGSMLFSCSPKGGQQEPSALTWPEITSETKPWTRWWWPASAVSKADMTDMLDAYSEVGFGGLEVTTIYGAKGYEDSYRTYLSKDWMDFFCYTLDEAEKRDLGIDLANASGWPFGGNWVTPDYACRYLATSTYKLKAGESLQEKIEYIQKPILRTIGLKTDFSNMEYPVAANDSLQQYAFDQVRYPQSLPLIALTAHGPDGGYMDLTDKVDAEGRLDWVAPQGDWTLCAMFLGYHGKMVERAGPGGEGDVIDHFSADAITRYLAHFDEAFKGYDLHHLRYYFNDSYEVDDAAGSSDWTENFFDEFQTRRGYDLKPHMLDLLDLSGDAQTSQRVLFDYRVTISELLTETYSMMWQKWAADQGKGIRNQAHGSPANILDLYRVSDVPETEGQNIIGMKTASSVSNITGKKLTSAEACTWLGEHFTSTLGDVKTALDNYFLAGVNHIVYHGTCMSPTDALWPGWNFYAAVHFQPANPFWKDLKAVNDYVARCQSFLQSGKADSDLLLYFDATSLISERGRELLYHMNHRTAYQSSMAEYSQGLYDKGYAWDYISDKMICDDLDVKGGKIISSEGASYSAIIIPECRLMVAETFAKLCELARKGATVMVMNSLPEDIPGLASLETKRSDFLKLKAKIRFSPDGAVSVARMGKGRFLLSDQLYEMLEYAGIGRERMYDSGLQCIRRQKEDGGRYYFVKNPGSSEFDGWLPLDISCASAGIYDPMSGECGVAAVRQDSKGLCELRVKLLPDQSLIIETFAGQCTGDEYPIYRKAGESLPVRGSWSVRFTDGGPSLPESRTVTTLTSWTNFGRPYESFAGSAEYSLSLKAMETDADAFLLDLGKVCESAAVFLDGEYLGTVLKAPYSLTVPAEKIARGGKLCVRVSNLAGNRIAELDRKGVNWKYMYNANLQGRLPQNKDRNGIFTAANWDVADSGLLGPVSLTALKRAE